MLRLLKEPLVHFLLLGGTVFAVFSLTRDPAGAAPRDAIVVTAGQVRQLAAVFEKTWQRPPTPAELERLIEARVREEVFAREALAAGLDKDDTVVRRRMKQKLEFLLEDIAGPITPTEQELQAFLDANADRFRSEATFSFRQIYVSTDRRDDPAEDARALLARLQGGETDIAGDRLMMVEPVFEEAPERDVARTFGGEFAAALAEAPTGEWSGPIRSGYGLHLVYVDSRTQGAVARLEDVRDAVAREWSVVRRREANEALYEELRKKYTVTVERE
jgi:parvulin-like peptidyl-prolyl isomerase